MAAYQKLDPVRLPTPPPIGEPPQLDQPWHNLPIETVITQFETLPTTGLSAEVAQQRLIAYGPNQIDANPKRSPLSLVIDQFTTWPVALLTAAALISVGTGSPVDAVVIMGVVIINAIIGYVTESQSERVIRALQQETRPMARLVREGQVVTLDATAVVPGDILLLQPGQSVAADARLIEADQLTIDEAALTGESLPVTKQTQPLAIDPTPLAEQNNRVFKGTLITSGRGRAVVVATGGQTELGKIQALVGATVAMETPLQGQLAQVSQQLVMLCGGVCVAIFGVGALRGYGLLPLLKTSISLAVAAVPEGLPAVATTTLALGIQNMRQRRILIRALNAVEALGAVQVICLDKTGTLTRNQMAVQEVYLATGSQLGPDHPDPSNLDVSQSGTLSHLLQIGVLCNESDLQPSIDGTIEVRGSATETALIHLALAAGLEVLAWRDRYPLITINHRSDGRALMSTLHHTPTGERLAAVKGSPAAVLERCRRWQVADQVQPLSDADRQALIQANQHLADQALRVLAIAYRHLAPQEDYDEQDLIWLGLVGLADPIREGVPELIADFHRAGIDTVMVTGDQRSTAQAIGQRLRLNRQGNLTILDAGDLAHLEEEELAQMAHQVDIFARISPADKLNVVRALQSAQKIVAMTGDGINDTPALKAANVGLAMGSGQAEGVHDVADVVIQDDNLATLIEAVSQGRTIYTNIRKAVHFLLATNLSEIMVVAVATLLGLGEPLNAIQLLWLNLVTDVFPGLGLALEPPEPNVLDQPPRTPSERIIKPSDFQRISWEASILSLGALAAYGYGIATYGLGPQASTLAFMGLTIGQVLHTFSCRSETHRWFDPNPLPRNPYVELAIAGSLALQLLPLVLPGLGHLLKIAPLARLDYLVMALAAVVPLVVNEATKGWLRGR